MKDDKKIGSMKDGDSFGENGLLSGNQKRNATIIAADEVKCLALARDQLNAILGDKIEVIGQSYVAIYDHNRLLDSGGRFYFLSPGDTYHLQTREGFRPAETFLPLERVVKRSWTGR